MLILGIETSCDETAVGVVEDGRRLRSNVIASQAALHATHGGVVPELASRQHIRDMQPTLHRALSDAEVALESDEDAYLYLLSGNNPSGTSYLEQDDNGGPGLDARITEDLAPGTYTIVATTRDAGREDDYTLTVSGHR